MNVQQIEKWKTVRAKGRKRYLLKRTLLWGTIWSVIVIGQEELRSRLYARQVAHITMDAIFGKDWNANPENPVIDFITSYYGQAIECFLLAGVIALAVWTYKEQIYSRRIPQFTARDLRNI
jgi:hypothetical protein